MHNSSLVVSYKKKTGQINLSLYVNTIRESILRSSNSY